MRHENLQMCNFTRNACFCIHPQHQLHHLLLLTMRFELLKSVHWRIELDAHQTYLGDLQDCTRKELPWWIAQENNITFFFHNPILQEVREASGCHDNHALVTAHAVIITRGKPVMREDMDASTFWCSSASKALITLLWCCNMCVQQFAWQEQCICV